jgi:hypothetical protein
MFQNRVPPTSKYPTTASLVTEHPMAPMVPPGTPARVVPVAAVVEDVAAVVVLVGLVVDVDVTLVEVVESVP